MFQSNYAVMFCLFVLFCSLDAFSYPLIPNPDLTHGELCTADDPDFATYRYCEQIPYCNRKVDFNLRQKIYDSYNIPVECRHRYTIDHFVPLALGGNNAVVNLWPEHKLVKATRPDLELGLFLALEKGEITQQEAIAQIIKAKTELQKAIIAKEQDDCDVPTMP